MKKLAKLLALVLSLVMVVSCFAACSGDKKEDKPSTEVKTSKTNADEPAEKPEKEPVKEEKGKSDEEEVEAFVDDFFKTFQSGDLEALADYFKESSDAYDEIMSSFNMDDITEMTSGMEELGLSEDDTADIITNVFEALFGQLEYEIGDIEVDGDKATVEYTMSIPDYSKVDQNSIDMDSLLMEILEDSGYDMEKLSTMTEDDLKDIMPEIMGTVMDSFVDAMIDAAKDLDPMEESGNFELEKVDGEWLIVADL